MLAPYKKLPRLPEEEEEVDPLEGTIEEVGWGSEAKEGKERTEEGTHKCVKQLLSIHSSFPLLFSHPPHIHTHTQEEDYRSFLEKLAKGPEKLPPADQQLDAAEGTWVCV